MSEAPQTRDLVTTFKAQMTNNEHEFQMALPAHIPVERFVRVVLTAVNANPKLLTADRRSLFEAAMKAAQDGLLPDGREGAFSTFSTKVKGDDGRDTWIDKVTWMPMIAGIRKKVRNSDTIETWDVQAVHEKDEFDYELGDNPFIKHKPCIRGDRGPIIAVYSIATLKSGEKSRDVMSVHEVEYVRDTYSKKDRDGKFSAAWVKSFGEMAKKTLARRHSKVLPMSTDLDDLIRRDDELYDLKGGESEAQAAKLFETPARTRLAEKLSAAPKGVAGFSPEFAAAEIEGRALADEPSAAQDPVADGGAATATDAAGDGGDGWHGAPVASEVSPAATVAQGNESAPAGAAGPAIDDWFANGAKAARDGMSRKAIPPELRTGDHAAEIEKYLEGFDSVKGAA